MKRSHLSRTNPDWRRACWMLMMLVTTTVMADSLPTIESTWNFNDLDESEQKFRNLIVQAGSNTAYAAEATTQLARTMSLRGRFDEANAILDQAQTMLTPAMPGARVRLFLERGRTLNSSGLAKESITLFEQALDLANANHLDYLAVDAAHMLGIVEEPAIAISWNERAIQMAETSTDARRWLGPLYNNLAWTYNDLGRHADALALFEKDTAYREDQGLEFEAGIARWSHAKTLRLLGQVDAALAELLALVDHPLRQNNPAQGYTHEEIGECLLLLGRSPEAAPHFAIAYARLREDSWLVQNEQDRLDRLHRLAAVH